MCLRASLLSQSGLGKSPLKFCSPFAPTDDDALPRTIAVNGNHTHLGPTIINTISTPTSDTTIIEANSPPPEATDILTFLKMEAGPWASFPSTKAAVTQTHPQQMLAVDISLAFKESVAGRETERSAQRVVVVAVSESMKAETNAAPLVRSKAKVSVVVSKRVEKMDDSVLMLCCLSPGNPRFPSSGKNPFGQLSASGTFKPAGKDGLDPSNDKRVCSGICSYISLSALH